MFNSVWKEIFHTSLSIFGLLRPATVVINLTYKEANKMIIIIIIIIIPSPFLFKVNSNQKSFRNPLDKLSARPIALNPTRAHLSTVWSGSLWGGLRAMGRAASSSSVFLNDF